MTRSQNTVAPVVGRCAGCCVGCLVLFLRYVFGGVCGVSAAYALDAQPLGLALGAGVSGVLVGAVVGLLAADYLERPTAPHPQPQPRKGRHS